MYILNYHIGSSSGDFNGVANSPHSLTIHLNYFYNKGEDLRIKMRVGLCLILQSDQVSTTPFL